MPTLVVDVRGVEPHPKGSMGARIIAGRAQPYHPATAAYTTWCSAVDAAAQAVAVERGLDPIDDHVAIRIDFYLTRPGRTRFGDRPAGKPDIDKLYRAVLDNLAPLIHDDARVVSLNGAKWWATDDEPIGCRIQLGIVRAEAA